MKKPLGFLSGLLRVTGALGLAISSSPARKVRPDFQLPVQNYAAIEVSMGYSDWSDPQSHYSL